MSWDLRGALRSAWERLLRDKRRLRRIAAYASLFAVVFVLALYATFPYDRLRVELERQLRQEPTRIGGASLDVRIAELRPFWLTGLSLSGVEVERRFASTDQPPLRIHVTEAQARLHVLPLLIGRKVVGIGLQVGGGELAGTLGLPGEGYRIDLEARNIELGVLGLLRTAIGVPLRGRLSGRVDLTIPEAVREASGAIDVSITGTRLGNGKAKVRVAGLQDGITLAAVNAGDLNLKVKLDQGVAQLQELKAAGRDLKLEGRGNLRLMTPLRFSRLDVLLRADFSDGYRNRSKKTRALFALMDFEPTLKQAQASDGALQYRIRGALGGNFRASPAGGERF